MKFFLPFLLTVLLPCAIFSQEKEPVPQLSKTVIGNSGCSAYLPQGFPEFEVSFSEDSSLVYVSEMGIGNYYFGCITVKFAEPFDASVSGDEFEELLIAYMAFLENSLDITGAAGIGRGHRLESSPDARGVIDYWEDEAGNHYAVKGWANAKNLGVLYITGPDEYPYFNLQKMFLDGFRFER